jgi:dihydropyrimidinase
MDLMIRGGTLVFDGIEMPADLYVDDGKIAGFGRGLVAEADQVVNAEGCFVLPGLVDVDSLLDLSAAGQLSADLVAKASQMAVLGGFTTHSVDYPSSDGPEGVRQAMGQSALADFAPRALVSKRGADARRKASDALRSGDSAGVRASLRKLSHAVDGLPDDDVFALLREAGANRCVFLNPQSGPLGDMALSVAASRGGSPDEQRGAAHPAHLARAGMRLISSLLETASANVAVLPITCSPEIEALLEARDRLGAGVMAVTSLPYLLFFADDEGAAPAGRLPAGYPPLRRKPDSVHLWKSLDAGLIDVIATSAAAPDDALLGNPVYALPALYGQGVMGRRVSLQTLISALCDNPAKMLSLYPRKGTLQVGSDADIVVFDPEGRTPAPENSPYAKLNMAGKVELVIRRGEVLVDGSQLAEGVGRGQEVKPGAEAAELRK